MDEKRDRVYVKWGLTALAVICISVVLVVIFTDLPGFFGVLRGLEAILEPLILGAVFEMLYLLISDSVNEKLRKKSLTTDTRAYRDIQTVDELPKTEETGEK